MSSLSKSKYPSGLNIYSVGKAKEMSTKIKTVSLNPYGGLENSKPQGNPGKNSEVIINTRSSASNNTSTKTGNLNNPTSNSFRQPGILTKKFKTAKSSPERYFYEDRNISEDNSKLLVQNFIRPSVDNSGNLQQNNYVKQSGGSGSILMDPNNPIDELAEINDANALEIFAKKLMKNSDSKQKVNQLNSTNPINNPYLSKNLIKEKIDSGKTLKNDNSESKAFNKTNSLKQNVTRTSTNMNDDIIINYPEGNSEAIGHNIKNYSPRYNGMLKKYYDINQKEALNKNGVVYEAQKKVVNSSSVKKIQSSNLGKLTSDSNSLSSIPNVNKLINKFVSNPENIINNLKKKTTPILNENNNSDQSLLRQQTPNLLQSSVLKKNANLKNSNKVSITTPVTNKNSRKNSLEKSAVKNITNNQKQKGGTETGSMIENSNKNINTNNQVSNTQNTATKLQTRVGSVVNSNYVSNNSNLNLSHNNSFQNMTNQSVSKMMQNMNPSLHPQNKQKSEDSNLVTENSKKSQKINAIDTDNLNVMESNNNLKLFNVSQALKNTHTSSTINKKNSNSSVPFTNQSSISGSKNNSKSASRINEKPETMRKKIIESEVKKINNNGTNQYENMNTINIKTQLNEKFNYKKHLTSTNSPTHFPFNFNKENIHTNAHANPVTDKTNNLNKNNVIKQQDKNNSVSKPREEAITLKNKPVVSLKLNLSNNLKSNEKELSISTSQNHNNLKGLTNPNSMIQSKEKLTGNNQKVNIHYSEKNSTNQSRRVSKSKLDLKNQKDINNAAPTNTDVNINLDTSLDNELDNSTTSMKSTMRESNYYKREAEKISNYIKQFHQQYNEYPPTSLKFYKFGRLLGRGAFGKVNLCLHTLSGRLIAVKSFNKSQLTSESSKRKIYHETNLMKNLKHNSIVKIYEVIESTKYILIVMEYVCGGDLLSFVRKRTKLNETTSKFIFRQIIEALQYVHSQKIVHRDIKLDNILIDLNNNIKICDFGVSRQVRKEDIMHDQCGTPAYIAPEILKNQGYEGFGVDLWSAGVVLYAMLSGTVPFKATNMSDLHRLILAGNYSPIRDISQEAADLLSGILEVNPRKRLNVEQILNHEWLRSSEEIINGKNKYLSKMNLFTNAERILLSKSNIDYKTAEKEDLIENFTLKNLDTMQESENQNVNTKSFILAPFNSSLKTEKDVLHPALKIENDEIKFCGKAKEANRHYELNNNGEIDNGILINQKNIEDNPSINDDSQSNNIYKDKDIKSVIPSSKFSKNVSKPTSPPEYNKDGKMSEVPSPKEDSHRHSRKNTKDLSITNANTFVLDENVVKMLDNLGYKKEYLLKCLYNNELNYATATYYLFLNSTLD